VLIASGQLGCAADVLQHWATVAALANLVPQIRGDA
jgi:hypothetical protein